MPILFSQKFRFLCQTEIDLSGNGQTHEEPVAKAVVVDELEDVLHCQQCEKVSTAVTSLTLTQLDNASNDDDNEGCHLGI
ncbi:hypothetical protein INR49_001250, partial [Caranx melampygus]